MIVQVLDLFFCIFFTLEIILKLVAYRLRFFRRFGWGWNCFDLILVVTQFCDQLITIIGMESSGQEGTVWRIFRLLRAVRVVRVLRVMAVAEDLQLLVSCILHSFSSFFWACILLLIMIYIVSIYLTQLILNERLIGKLSNEADGRVTGLYGS